MKRAELTDQIKGSYLKKHYLEAFLLQSSYVEGLIKLYTDYQLWTELYEEEVEEAKKKINQPIIKKLRGDIEKKALGQLIRFLVDTGMIDKEVEGKLTKYCKSRNTIIHDLVNEMIKEQSFENELKTAYSLGESIINNDAIKHIEKLLDDRDEMMAEAQTQTQV